MVVTFFSPDANVCSVDFGKFCEGLELDLRTNVAGESAGQIPHARRVALVHESSRKWDDCLDLGGPVGPIDHILSMNSRIHPKYKTKYRVSNWAEYDPRRSQQVDVGLHLAATKGRLRIVVDSAGLFIIGEFAIGS